MIPSRLSDDTKSYAEKVLFYKLQDMEDTDDWMVLPARVICGYTREMTYMQQEENLRNCLRIVVEENAGRKT